MRIHVKQFQLIAQCIVCSFLIPASIRGQALRSISTTLTPRDDLQSAVNSKPEGTKFVLLPGVYRMQSVVPKNYDTFTGQEGVVLNGSQLLSFHRDPKVSGLWVANATISSWVHGECQASYPLCGYTQDLFFDNVLQTPASTLDGLKPGFWYADRTHGEVYVARDPQNQIVELGTLATAFNAAKSVGVHISDVIVEKYAAAAQQGAIGGDRTGKGWIVDHVEVRWNHGAGIELGSNSEISNSFIHHNGQLGICFVGTDDKAIKNEISWNNYAGFTTDSEAGGGKFLQTSNLVLQSNYVHDNAGTGLWTDTNAVNTLYEGNTIVNNANQGIQHEASYRATIRKNIVRGNGNSKTVGPWNAQILLQSSSNVEIYENTIEVPAGGGNGIILMNENRGNGNLGPFVTAYDRVHDNIIIYSSNNGYSGIVDIPGADIDSAVGNTFNSNHYKLQVGNGSDYHWQWFDSKDWNGIRKEGQEALGICCK